MSLLGEEGKTTLVDENGVEWLVGDASLEAAKSWMAAVTSWRGLRAGPASGSGGGRSSRIRGCMGVGGRGGLNKGVVWGWATMRGLRYGADPRSTLRLGFRLGGSATG